MSCTVAMFLCVQILNMIMYIRMYTYTNVCMYIYKCMIMCINIFIGVTRKGEATVAAAPDDTF